MKKAEKRHKQRLQEYKEQKIGFATEEREYLLDSSTCNKNFKISLLAMTWELRGYTCRIYIWSGCGNYSIKGTNFVGVS